MAMRGQPGRTAFDPRFTGTREVLEKHRFPTGALERWLAGRVPGLRGPLEVREFRGGQSNPTYELVAPSERLVLRRKPPGKLLPTAHAVEREYRVIAALNQIGFPVPRAHALCEDPRVIGTPFYVMERVEGRVIWDPLLPGFEPAERRAIYDSMNQILARLHLADYRALGLEDFGRPGNYFSRQISRWSKQYLASETEKVEEMDRLIEWLPRNVPPEDSASLVHGDYKLDNMIVHPSEPRVIAILDWELSTIGHPLGDLTYQLAQRRSPASAFAGLGDEELRARGVPTEAEYVDAYCRRTGRAGIPELGFYIAYNLFRSACILQGIIGRVRDGTAASEHAAELAASVRPLAARALQEVNSSTTSPR
jgi:aminoglycoside phosphotransferase (APT) family kinase protein